MYSPLIIQNFCNILNYLAWKNYSNAQNDPDFSFENVPSSYISLPGRMLSIAFMVKLNLKLLTPAGSFVPESKGPYWLERFNQVIKKENRQPLNGAMTSSNPKNSKSTTLKWR
jgi:hypothetical protein